MAAGESAFSRMRYLQAYHSVVHSAMKAKAELFLTSRLEERNRNLSPPDQSRNVACLTQTDERMTRPRH
jgi:hypothetical protein